MGKTSSAVKNRWNKANYDQINVVVPKGQKEILKAYAASKGVSVNSLISEFIASLISVQE